MAAYNLKILALEMVDDLRPFRGNCRTSCRQAGWLRCRAGGVTRDLVEIGLRQFSHYGLIRNSCHLLGAGNAQMIPVYASPNDY